MSAPPTHPAPAATTAKRAQRARLVATARAVRVREPGLVAVGSAGLVLAGVCLAGVAIHGRTLEPEGKLLDAAVFAFGIGVYTLTIALLLPLAGYSAMARRRWRRAFYVYPVYGLALETLQAFRGLDPRFTEAGAPIDVVAGIVFGVTAASTTVLFVVLGLRFFRPGVLDDRRVLRLGIRYGTLAVGVSFGIGVVMSFNGGRHLGDDGNLLLAHALGVHGLQALPLLGALAAAGTLAGPGRWVHAGGIAWLLACIAALTQALVGQQATELSVTAVVIVGGLVAWSSATTASLVSSLHAATWRTA
jgi:hypothetical protein